MHLPPTLAELLQLAFGPDWRKRAQREFHRSRRQIERWCSGETRIPRRFLIQLQHYAPFEVESIERRRRERHRDVDVAADARREAAFQAGTWLKAMLFDKPEWEAPPKVGGQRRPPSSHEKSKTELATKLI